MNILSSTTVKVEKIIHALDKKEKFYEKYSEKVDEVIALNKEIFSQKMFILNPGKQDEMWIKNAGKSFEKKRAQLDAHFIAFKCVQLITSGEKNSEMLKFVCDSGSFNIDVLPKGEGIAIRNFLKTKGSYTKYRDSYVKYDNLESDILNLIEKITPITKKEFLTLIKSDIAYFERIKLDDCVKINHKKDTIRRI